MEIEVNKIDEIKIGDELLSTLLSKSGNMINTLSYTLDKLGRRISMSGLSYSKDLKEYSYNDLFIDSKVIIDNNFDNSIYYKLKVTITENIGCFKIDLINVLETGTSIEKDSIFESPLFLPINATDTECLDLVEKLAKALIETNNHYKKINTSSKKEKLDSNSIDYLSYLIDKLDDNTLIKVKKIIESIIK